MIAASLINDYATLIGALAALIIAATIALSRRQFKTVSASFGELTVKLDQNATALEAVNKAVNNVPAGSHTLIERVATVEDGQRWTQDALVLLANHVGLTLTSPPRPRWYR